MVWHRTDEEKEFIERVENMAPFTKRALHSKYLFLASQCPVRVMYEVVGCVPHSMQIAFVDSQRTLRYATILGAMKAAHALTNQHSGGCFAIIHGTRAENARCPFLVDVRTLGGAYYDAENQIVAKRYTMVAVHPVTKVLSTPAPHGFSFSLSFSRLAMARKCEQFLSLLYVYGFTHLFVDGKGSRAYIAITDRFLTDREGKYMPNILAPDVTANDDEEREDEENIERELRREYDSDEFDDDAISQYMHSTLEKVD